MLKTFAVLILFVIVPAAFSGTSGSSTAAVAIPTPSPTPKVKKSPAPSPRTTPQSTKEIYERALGDYNAKEFDKAETGFKQVVAAEPNHADANFYLGKIYYDKTEYETSLPHFEKAAKVQRNSVEKLMALGDNQRVLKKYSVAVVQYQRIIGFEPENPNAYFGLGSTYVGLNNKIAARQQLQKLKPLDKALADQLTKAIDAMK